MRNHLQRWGAVWILFGLFTLSWFAHGVVTLILLEESGTDFWQQTLENWQSEWLQLLVQAVIVVGLAEKLFRKSTEQMDRIEKMLHNLHMDKD